MITIFHASDLHFGPAFEPRVGEALLHSARELAPDVLVVSGDLTMRAKRAQFEAARAFLDRLVAAAMEARGGGAVPLIVTISSSPIPRSFI